MMLNAIKRLLGGSSSAGPGDQKKILAAWAKEAGHKVKPVLGPLGGVVVTTDEGWRAEWGSSQRSYISGHELRLRHESALPGDVQMLFLTQALAHVLESEVFDSFTDGMQTRIDTAMPDEMRWLAMHHRMTMSDQPVLNKRFLMVTNAEDVSRRWLGAAFGRALENAAIDWWVDSLLMVLTVNRGILTLRMSGDDLSLPQLHAVSALFSLAAREISEIE
ncbi:MAG TPA: hypothetical protein PKV17_01315 [Aquabacterium sp.]|jgi:hypothetical protein|nr:hypothetical protein [Aquabacterium sp.]HRH27403.1 hypothetical protein [Aquabacterium sp.]